MRKCYFNLNNNIISLKARPITAIFSIIKLIKDFKNFRVGVRKDFRKQPQLIIVNLERLVVYCYFQVFIVKRATFK